MSAIAKQLLEGAVGLLNYAACCCRPAAFSNCVNKCGYFWTIGKLSSRIALVKAKKTSSSLQHKKLKPYVILTRMFLHANLAKKGINS